jgi:hypothetical protein
VDAPFEVLHILGSGQLSLKAATGYVARRRLERRDHLLERLRGRVLDVLHCKLLAHGRSSFPEGSGQLQTGLALAF